MGATACFVRSRTPLYSSETAGLLGVSARQSNSAEYTQVNQDAVRIRFDRMLMCISVLCA